MTEARTDLIAALVREADIPQPTDTTHITLAEVNDWLDDADQSRLYGSDAVEHAARKARAKMERTVNGPCQCSQQRAVLECNVHRDAPPDLRRESWRKHIMVPYACRVCGTNSQFPVYPGIGEWRASGEGYECCGRIGSRRCDAPIPPADVRAILAVVGNLRRTFDALYGEAVMIEGRANLTVEDGVALLPPDFAKMRECIANGKNSMLCIPVGRVLPTDVTRVAASGQRRFGQPRMEEPSQRQRRPMVRV